MSTKQPRQPQQRRQRNPTPPTPATKPLNGHRTLDLLFIHDCTASQTPYISGTVSRCLEIIEVIQGLGKVDTNKGMRVGLIAFCDHSKEEDFEFKDFGGFTHDVSKVFQNLRSLEASGGADYPEAVTTALAHSLKLDWRDDAAKLIILVTDASPHGIGEEGDDYEKGDPHGHDPLQVAKKMAARGITMLLVACEPVLSNDNDYAHDFYAALTKITNGKMVPLLDVRVLSTFIIGFALQQMGLDDLSKEYKEPILTMHKKGFSLKEMTRAVWDWLSNRSQKVYTIEMNQVYHEPPEFDEVVKLWLSAESISSVREQVWKKTNISERIPPRHIAPASGWERTKVDITLKNLHEQNIIDFRYRDPNLDVDPEVDGVDPIRMGSLGPSQILPPKALLAHTDYYFDLRSGSAERGPIRQNFSHRQDFDLSVHFK